jgi:uncharacterized protein YodC (DUF2158 family)
MHNIKKGDIVWLKSGGPKMTIKTTSEDEICTCIWFKHGELQYCDLESDTLTIVDPDLFENDSSETLPE